MKKNLIAMSALALAFLCSTPVVRATDNPAKAKKVVAKPATTLYVDPVASTLNWTAKKVGGGHNGTVKISKGTLAIAGDKLTGGNFVMDMTTIADADQSARLTTHLKSDDFFSVEKNPTSTFVITKAAPVGKAKGGMANYNITGNLTIKGITNPVTFPAVVKLNENGAEATAKIEIDRLKWDIKFRSGIIGTAADKIIEDTFVMDVKLVAGKNNTAKL